MNSIGVDIGGSHITACMYDHDNKVLKKDTLVHRKVNNKASKDDIIRHWVEAITETQSKENQAVAGVGLAVPSPFDYYNGICLMQGSNDKFESLYRVNIKSALSEGLGIDASNIRFINDAAAFAIADNLVGQTAKYKRAVAITLGTGFGASFVNNKQPIIGSKNVPKNGMLFDKLYNGKMADDVFSGRGLLALYKQISGQDVQNVFDLSGLAKEGDDKALITFDVYGGRLGDFLYPYLSEFDAEALVIGGNIAKAYPLFSSELENELPSLNIYTSHDGEAAAMIGSALLLNDGYYQKLEKALKAM